nr:hypothetical protein Q903MT_gene579 [Picea sitchensis]
MVAFCQKYNIILSHSSNYYPQGNGQDESSNKNLMKIIKNTLADNKKAWGSQLGYALWADRISTKGLQERPLSSKSMVWKWSYQFN